MTVLPGKGSIRESACCIFDFARFRACTNLEDRFSLLESLHQSDEAPASIERFGFSIYKIFVGTFVCMFVTVSLVRVCNTITHSTSTIRTDM